MRWSHKKTHYLPPRPFFLLQLKPLSHRLPFLLPYFSVCETHWDQSGPLCMSTGWGRVVQATNQRVQHWREWQPPLTADGCRQPFKEGLDLRSPSLSHEEVRMDPSLSRSCPAGQSCSESVGTVALPYPEDTSVRHPSLSSGSYILFTPFMVPSLGGVT